jgi:hypothetical protein
VNPRAGLDDVEKRKFFALQGFELQTLGHPARSQSLYRLRYLGSSDRKDKFQRILIATNFNGGHLKERKIFGG